MELPQGAHIDPPKSSESVDFLHDLSCFLATGSGFGAASLLQVVPPEGRTPGDVKSTMGALQKPLAQVRCDERRTTKVPRFRRRFAAVSPWRRFAAVPSVVRGLFFGVRAQLPPKVQQFRDQGFLLWIEVCAVHSAKSGLFVKRRP